MYIYPSSPGACYLFCGQTDLLCLLTTQWNHNSLFYNSARITFFNVFIEFTNYLWSKSHANMSLYFPLHNWEWWILHVTISLLHIFIFAAKYYNLNVYMSVCPVDFELPQCRDHFSFIFIIFLCLTSMLPKQMLNNVFR